MQRSGLREAVPWPFEALLVPRARLRDGYSFNGSVEIEFESEEVPSFASFY